MRIKRFSVILAVLLVAILALGAVSAESIDDANLDLADDSVDAVSIDSIDDVSVDITDKDVKNSLSANIVGNESGTDEGEAEEMANYDIDDDTYSYYFNEDGTPTDALSAEGNYTLNIGTLTNKDIKIDAGNNIFIFNKLDEGTIYNGTITIGTGDAAMKTIGIGGLSFINENKDAIVINELCSDVTIDSNSLDLTYDNESISNAIAIKTNGYVKNVVISNNQIFMDSAVNYTYGIDIAYYKTWTEYAIANPEAVDLLDNVIEITSSAESGMAEAIYFDTAINSLIDANEITVTTTNPDVANYALQVADSWGFYNDPFAFSPSNITISGNEITQNSADMAYGITVISLTDFDEDNAKIEKFFNISDNIVEINSESAAVGIGVKTSYATVEDNLIFISAAEDESSIGSPDPAFGNQSVAIFVNNLDSFMGYYNNIAVTDNTIVANVDDIKVTKTVDEQPEVAPLVIQDNDIVEDYFIVSDDTYADLFNEDGTPNDVLGADGDYVLFIDSITDKNIWIDSGSAIEIRPYGSKGNIVNGSIIIGDGEGSAGLLSISGLTISNVDKNPIIINDLSTFVEISDNELILTYTSDFAGSAMAIVTYGYVYGIDITDNDIWMESEVGYTYGIDVNAYRADWSYADANPEEIIISGNSISIISSASSGMVEAIYLDTISQAKVEENTVYVETVESVANYGIQVSDSHRYATSLNSSSGVSIIGNTFELCSNDMAYGITVISLSNVDTEGEVQVKDFVISGNKVKISSEKGAIAIGVKTSDVEVMGNIIELLADSDAINQCYPDPAFGNESVAIFVNDYDNYYGEITHFYNNTVVDNDVESNVLAIKVTEETDDNDPIIIEDNTIEVDVSIKIETDVPAVKTGHDITYTVTVTNDGPNFANDVIVSFDIEGSVILADYPEEYDPDTGIWIVDVAPGTSEELVITATDYIEETINATAKIEDMGEYLTNLATETEDSNQVPVYTIVIDDTNYEDFFDEIGALRNDTQIESGDTICLGDLTNKNLIFDIPLTIYPDTLESKLVNTTITIGEGADGTNVSGLVFEFTGDENTGSTAIIYAVGVSDIEISENTIIVTNFVDKAGAKYGSTLYAIEVESGAAGANNVLIRSNNINIVGSSRYLYGIDVFKTWGSENGNSNVTIDYNVITIDPASRMAEGIYASDIDNAVIEYNIINSIGDAAAYGIGSDSLTNSIIDKNNITATAGTQAYGITNTNSKDVNIIDNIINASGIGAVGVGMNGENTLVENNTIEINGGDYTSITSADSLGTANAGILDKGKSNTIGENDITENCPPTITDDNYNQYFDENGKVLNTSGIEDGDLIFIGELSNKDLIIDMPLIIKGTTGTKATNVTIALKEGADGTSISKLDMVYEDDGSATFAVISVHDGIDYIDISENTMDITTASSWNYNMAIAVYGATEGSEGIVISENAITVSTNSGGFYGIDVQNYDDSWNKGEGTTGLSIFDNIVLINGTGMIEPIYVSSCNDVLIWNNTLSTQTSTGDGYGIGTSANNNINITDNVIIVYSDNNMAYGIAIPDSKDVIVDNNTIAAEGAGAIGIGLVNDENVEIDGNDITIEGGDYTGVTTYEKIGKANAAIFDKSGNTGVEIGENTIDETAPIIVDDSSYDKYFNEDGTIKDDAPIVLGSTILIGELNDKKLVIDQTVTIQPADVSKLTNTVIELGEGSDGTVVKDLDIEFTGDETTGSVGIIYAHDTSDIVIANNTITVPAFVNKEGSTYGSAVYAIEVESGVYGTDNITIEGNYIEINGTASYLYGIDAFASWGQNTTNSNLTIEDNTIIINGGARMAEAIYVSASEDVSIAGNNVTALSDAAAYGIATDQLDGAEIVDNDVNVEAGTTGYGITATTSGKDVLIESNNVMTQGTSAVGVGLSGQDNVTVKDNEIETLAGDYASVKSSDNLGTANAAILDKDNKNTNLVLENNTLIENGKQVNTTHNGNASSELQALIDAAEPGSTLDLEGVIYSGISDVVIDKDLTITNGTISGKEGETVFVIPAKSEGGPDEVTITGVDFIINNGNTIVKATADNGTTPTSIDTPAITLTNNTVGTLKEDVVPESVTLLELESERGSLAPTSPITVEGNTLDSGVDPFEFKVTGVSDESGNVVIPAGGNIPERQATVIHYQDMKTSTVNTAIEGRVGKYFEVNLTDANGNPLANKEVKIGFNGKVYNKTTNATGGVRLQINLAKKGLYTFAISFLGDDNYNASFEVSKINVTVQKTKLTTSNKSYKASAKTKSLTVTLKSAEYNKAIPSKKITVTVNGKSYTAKTNSKGVATVKVSLSAKKTYKFTAKFAGDDRYAAASVTGKVTIK